MLVLGNHHIYAISVLVLRMYSKHLYLLFLFDLDIDLGDQEKGAVGLANKLSTLIH
jgi:hypothetical protein